MSKAFDSLCHSLIVKKLEAYGFGPNSLSLLRSYFDNRLNRVNILDVTSDWKRMVLGCPQGSSFSPLLCNLFQNDMSFHINNANLSMYADDHQMYVMRKKHDVVAQSIKIQGEQALSRYKNNYLLANPEKFQLLAINPRNVDTDNDNQDISLDGHAIERMGEIKLLGVQIDEKRSFASHISELCTKASQKVGFLVRLRNLIPCNAKVFNSAPSNLLSSTLALLECIGSEKAQADSGASAESGVQNHISVLSRTAARPRQTTDDVQSASTRHCHFDV